MTPGQWALVVVSSPVGFALVLLVSSIYRDRWEDRHQVCRRCRRITDDALADVGYSWEEL